MQTVRYICINLKRSIKRREHARRQFEKFSIPAAFVTAVDGQQLEIQIKGAIKEFVYKNKRYVHTRQCVPHLRQRDLSANVLGCALSHYLAYGRFLRAKTYDGLFVFEDDFLFDVEPGQFWEYMHYLPPMDSFDLCFFSNRHSKALPYPSDVRINEFYGRIRHPFLWYSGASGYICTRRGARQLFGKGQLIRFAADDYLNYKINSLDLVAICPDRPLIVGHGRFPSDIGEGDRHGTQ